MIKHTYAGRNFEIAKSYVKTVGGAFCLVIGTAAIPSTIHIFKDLGINDATLAALSVLGDFYLAKCGLELMGDAREERVIINTFADLESLLQGRRDGNVIELTPNEYTIQ